MVEWRSGDAEPLFLTIKRPEKGLLAGLEEFPSVTLPSAISESTSATSPTLLKFLKALLPTSSSQTRSHTQHSTVPHIFSHISMSYHCSRLLITAPDPPPKVPRGTWRTSEGIDASSMGTGGFKCWDVVQGIEPASKGKGKGKAKPAKRKSAAADMDGDDEEDLPKTKKKAAGKTPKQKKEADAAASSKKISDFFKPKAASADDGTVKKSESAAAPVPSVKSKRKWAVESDDEDEPSDDGAVPPVVPASSS